MTFPKRKRLARASFPLVASSRRRAISAHFSLTASSQAGGYAVVVSKQVAKRSVDRHRLKRRVAEALKAFPLPPALVVYARAGAPSLSFQEISGELRAAVAEIS
ncbi:MAG: ribonuclease P protein component [Minisyncoccia bacterium]